MDREGIHENRMKPHNVLVITYWSWADALVQTYTLPYLRIMERTLPPGSRIHLVTLEKDGSPAPDAGSGGPIVHHRFRYRPLGPRALGMILALVWQLRSVVRRNDIRTIHAWCTPAGMIGYLVSILTARPLVIDSYEPHAEAMVENGTWRRDALGSKVLFFFERLQTRRASVLIAAAEGMREYARHKYGLGDTLFFVKPACVDLERFSAKEIKRPELLKELGLDGKLVVVYAGKFGGIYLDQEVFDLLRVAREKWGERLHVLLLTSHSTAELAPFMSKAGLDPSMFTVRFVPHRDIPRYVGLGDIALTPVRPVPTKRYCTPIKDGEYWALGLPVMITPSISDDSELIAKHGIGSILWGLDDEHYRKAVEEMDLLLRSHTREQLYARIRPIAEKYRNFGIAEHVYRSVYGEGK
ncbi:MAG TPA: glycosyltransferase [Flavobacteriales bacterium]|nr:glycosyltransferase [Flavobacteriales bacterium]